MNTTVQLQSRLIKYTLKWEKYKDKQAEEFGYNGDEDALSSKISSLDDD